ncbi:MAG: aspartate-semialdehyde dehydrogenase [Peptococcaceae bacterium]|jgi:aspartate-semialdehyde dehydrogenase|nr:aspartate-semialdehyde dehydrogenase [Peptococcaceae bacterium]
MASDQKWNVGIIGATGMVGQRLILLLHNHPWFNLTVLAASSRSAGKTYEESVGPRWSMTSPMPDPEKGMILLDGEKDVKAIAAQVDLIFCAVEMDKAALRALEETYAKLECPVFSNNSAHRWTPDVPMIIPELNPGHAEVIHQQRKRLGTTRGFIAVKSNCSLQSYLPPLWPLHERFGMQKALACTYQAISGAGKNFSTWPEMMDNVIPLIKGEEEKSEQEPLKIWGRVTPQGIVAAEEPSITSQCIRVPVTDGHLAAVFASFDKKPGIDEIKEIWAGFSGLPQELNLPSAPKQFLHYFEEEDRPQTRLDRDLEGGMAISIGRLRPDSQYDIKFVCLSHNTLRGAAGGNVLMAELMCKQGYVLKG